MPHLGSNISPGDGGVGRDYLVILSTKILFPPVSLHSHHYCISVMINSYPTILLVGDSLTEMAFGDQGYGAALVADVGGGYGTGTK